MTIEEIGSWVLVILVSGGGGGAIAFAVLKSTASKWLDSHFEHRLQAYKHAQQIEIEHLKMSISNLLDRAIKLNQREFDVLPESWVKLNDAYWSVAGLVAPLQETPNINHMNAAQQEEFIKECALAEWQKQELRGAKDKTEYYRASYSWLRLHECKLKVKDAFVHLKKHGIFMSEDIRNKLLVINNLAWGAVVEFELNLDERFEPKQSEDTVKFRKDAESLMSDVEIDIRKRVGFASEAKAVL
jgi:hypothetical protein